MNERPPSYDQELQATLEALVRTNLSRPYSDGEGVRGGVFVLRADQVPVEVRSVLQSVARAVLLSRRGTLSEQVKRLEMFEPAAAPPPRRLPMNGRVQARDRAPRDRVFQRSRRICQRRPRICDHSRRRTVDAGTMDQRDRESFVWFPGLGRRRGLYVVGKQPTTSDYAMVERSGRRPSR